MDVPAGIRAMVGQVISCLYKLKAHQFVVLAASFQKSRDSECVHLDVMDVKTKDKQVIRGCGLPHLLRF